jgi:16S rRNA G527 N7-methylase RsmG
MKGVFPAAEMAELASDVSVRAVIPLDVPDLGAERHLILLAPASSGS